MEGKKGKRKKKREKHARTSFPFSRGMRRHMPRGVVLTSNNTFPRNARATVRSTKGGGREGGREGRTHMPSRRSSNQSDEATKVPRRERKGRKKKKKKSNYPKRGKGIGHSPVFRKRVFVVTTAL